MNLSLALFFVFAQLAAVDGLVFHLFRYRLYAHPDSRAEHGVHTAMALGFLGVVWGMAYFRPSGVGWWTFAGWQALTLGVSFVDVWIEPRSRARFGGLSRTEYLFHMLMNTLHGIAVAVWAGATASDRLLPNAWGHAVFAWPWPLEIVRWVTLVVAFGIPLWHLALLARPPEDCVPALTA